MLTVTAEVLDQDESFTKVKASGRVGDRTSLTARLVLERYNLADRRPHGAAIDARVRSELRKLWAILQGPARPPAAREPHVRVGIPLGLASVPAGARRDG